MIYTRERISLRLVVVVAIAGLCTLLLPAQAHAAGRAARSGSTLTYDGGSESNSFTLFWDGRDFSFYDTGASSVLPGFGCRSVGSPYAGFDDEVACAGTGITTIRIRLGGGSDHGQVNLANRLPAGVALIVDLGDGTDNWEGSQYTADTVYGGAGNDTIAGRGANDRLFGGYGNDSLKGDAGNDYVSGGPGADNLDGVGGNDTVNGDGGNDRVLGNIGRDTVNGGAGHDYVSGGLGADRHFGGPGNDRFHDDHRGVSRAYRSPDSLNGGFGIDTADYSYRLGEATRLWLSLDGRANDGASGEGDQILGSVENIVGGIYSDVINGSAVTNVLRGGGGSDLIRGLGGNDRLFGDAAGDRLEGGPGSDILEGWYGRDTLVGGLGADALWGGPDGDVIYAKDSVRDRIYCGGGVDGASVDSRDYYTWLCEYIAK